MRKPEGVCLRELRLLAAAAALAFGLFAAGTPARAVDAVNVRTDAAAIDLTDVLERQRTEADRIQVSTAPGPDGIIRRIEVRGREVEHQLGGVRALQFRRRADRPADRDPALSHGGFGTVLARSRIVARGRHHAEFGRAPRPAGLRGRGYFPHHARSRHRHHLRRRIAHRQAAAALSVGAGRLQGQDQFVHALLRHRHRHRRIAGVVPDHPVRGEGQRDVPGRRRARLGGARLYRHRFRILGQGVRHVGGRRAHLARDRRSDPGRDLARVPVRLSESEPLACALRAYHHRLARRSGDADPARAVRSGGRRRHRALLARGRRVPRLWRRDLSRRPMASTARC